MILTPLQVQAAMDVFYKANVKNGLFHDNWLMATGEPTGGEHAQNKCSLTVTYIDRCHPSPFYDRRDS